MSLNSPLINYALAGLRRCWLAEHGRWSHIYHLDGRSNLNESLPHSDVFYTLNVLAGLSRVPEVPRWIGVKEIFNRNAPLLKELPVRKYALGTALWAAAEFELELPAAVMSDVKELLADSSAWREFYAQDIGMILIGVTAFSRAGGNEWKAIAHKLFDFIATNYTSTSKLFFDRPAGHRRRFSSFATQTYLTLACYEYGTAFENGRAIALANSCARALIARQGPDGEWPWFFDSSKGTVLDFYEVYSVHQYGMAPAFLNWAERLGVEGAREAIARGFKWVLGQNQLGLSMLRPDLQLSIRSQVRKGELRTSKLRALRAVRNAALGLKASLVRPEQVELRQECRSYELGWILWSFGQRTDLPELTHNDMFSVKSDAQPAPELVRT